MAQSSVWIHWIIIMGLVSTTVFLALFVLSSTHGRNTSQEDLVDISDLPYVFESTE